MIISPKGLAIQECDSCSLPNSLEIEYALFFIEYALPFIKLIPKSRHKQLNFVLH